MIRVLATPHYDVWLLRWPVGTRVEPHDHGESAGVFRVVEGRLLELRWVDGRTVARHLVAGATLEISRGVVHDVVAESDRALSVHVYSPPLVTMRFYDKHGVQVVRSEQVDAELVASLE